MRKFVITEKGVGLFAEGPEPKPESGQVFCRPLCVGLCGTDRLIFLNQMPAAKYPRVPCHEIVAIVIKDYSTRNFPANTVVAVDPYKNCGKCHACLNNRPNCCRNNQTLGVQREGVLQERVVLDAERLYPIPQGIDPKLFCLVEPLALALHVAKRAGNVNSKWCLVAGTGNVGGLLVAVLAKLGAKVIAWDIDEEKLKKAKANGAAVLIMANKPTAEVEVMQITDNEGVSFAFDAAGQSATVELCIRLAAFAGKVVIVGHSKQISSICASDIVFKELDIFGSRNSFNQFPSAIEMLANDPVFWDNLISHRFPFEKAVDAFKLVANNLEPYTKVVIDFPEQA
ncbi:Alcohol dehydrogenase, zinc-binding [sediment metagenome]|uniref:Alcohol dehydrogenase, zinc-binding n=1 Tax=sediment metagenome TaxID=749907 RepID=D9PGB7_9ZZZZ